MLGGKAWNYAWEIPGAQGKAANAPVKAASVSESRLEPDVRHRGEHE